MKKIDYLPIHDIERREAILIRIERLTELPLLVLAFIMIPLLIGPFLWDLSPTEEDVFLTLDTLIWALFAIDMFIKLSIAPHRMPYARKHWLEILVVVIPFIRPLRLVRLFVFGSRAFTGARRLVNIDFLLVYGIGLVIIAATVVASVEGGEDASIHSFPDALWWAVVTITTVGYGDMVPVSIAGRAMGYLLMFGGIAFFSGVTANMASYLMKGNDHHKTALDKLTDEIAALRQELARMQDNTGK